MTLDVVALLITVLMTGFGYLTGALTQVTRLVALVLAFLAAPVVANVYKILILGRGELGSAWMEWGVLVIAAISVYAVVSLLGYLLVKLLHASSDDLSDTDKKGGAVLGLIKALAVVYLLVCSLLMVETQLKKADPNDFLKLRSSVLLDATRRWPVVVSWGLPDVNHAMDVLKDLQGQTNDNTLPAKKTAQGPKIIGKSFQSSKMPSNDPMAQARALAQDPEIIQALRENDASRLMEDPRFRALLKKKEFQEAMGKKAQ